MAKKSADSRLSDGTMSADERAAIKERAAEVKKAARRQKSADKEAANLQDVLDAIAQMPDEDRELATRVHEIIVDAAPMLAARTWYGMPAYALDGDIVCFFQGSQKFKVRYSTLGFSDPAALDDGTMWPTAYALTKLTDGDVQTIRALIRKAVGAGD